ncbi:MAG: BatD family protein [candidate division Zixibacteria bacterium]
MIGKRIIAFSVLAFLLFSVDLYAITVTASVDTDEVELGDPVNLSITITGTGVSLPEPKLPDLSDFDVYSAGKNTSFSLQGGRSTSIRELSYTLIPKKIGRLIIGPVVVNYKKTMVSTEPIKINVRKPGVIRKDSRNKTRSSSKSTKKEQKEFFIEQVVNTKKPYVGQQVTLTFRFYQAGNLRDQPTLEWPGFAGLTVEDLPPIGRSRKYINNKLYQVTEIKRAIFPISSGEIVLEPTKLRINTDNFGITDPFGFFNRGSRRNKSQLITTNPIRLNVRPLPQKGKPGNFTGAVGKYIIRAIVDKDSVGVDEPISLKVILSGKGNIKSLSPVAVPEFTDFRVYESGKTESINQQGGKVSGTKTFELALIPKTSGVFTIPPLEYSFFNPSRGKYETISTKPIKITASGEGLADVGGAPKNIIEAARHSFGYIITEYPHQESSVDLPNSAWFWLIQGLPVIGILTAFGFRSHYRKILGDRSYARRVTASKRSKTIFKAAIACRNAGDLGRFYDHLYDAVIGYAADRLDLEKSGLTIDELRDMERIEQNTRRSLIEFLEICQNARFSPSGFDRDSAEQTLESGAELILRLEKIL